MRWLAVALIGLLTLVQYPLWIGKGGWLRVWEVDRQLQFQREANKKLEVRNAGLDAEVRDLKTGYDAIEERARYELGMIKLDEIFVQIPERAPGESLPRTSPAPARSGVAEASPNPNNPNNSKGERAQRSQSAQRAKPER